MSVRPAALIPPASQTRGRLTTAVSVPVASSGWFAPHRVRSGASYTLAAAARIGIGTPPGATAICTRLALAPRRRSLLQPRPRRQHVRGPAGVRPPGDRFRRPQGAARLDSRAGAAAHQTTAAPRSPRRKPNRAQKASTQAHRGTALALLVLRRRQHVWLGTDSPGTRIDREPTGENCEVSLQDARASPSAVPPSPQVSD
jgi:hypothetical protein